MPTVKSIPGPYRFSFYSFDCNEPMHVHIQREGMMCKFWINPLALAKNQGFDLYLGTEGTFGAITELTLAPQPLPCEQWGKVLPLP